MEIKITGDYDSPTAVFHVVLTGSILSSRRAETIARLTGRLAASGIIVHSVEDLPPVSPAKAAHPFKELKVPAKGKR